MSTEGFENVLGVGDDRKERNINESCVGDDRKERKINVVDWGWYVGVKGNLK